MRLLVLGGTVFLGRAVARQALAAGHDVTCLARGASGATVPGARFVTADRDRPDAYRVLGAERFDAVIDVTSYPGQARGAVAALADRIDHWVYVSSISVYSDRVTPGQHADTAPVLAPASPEQERAPRGDPANYGPCKVACEQAVRGGVGTDRSFICRAGLIVGPEDPSGRFTYWVARLARGGRVLAPGAPDEPVQVVDVRDLADWLLVAASERLSGTYDATSAPVTRAALLAEVAAGVGAQPEFTWVDQDFLAEHGVRPWAGERSMPLWVPLPDHAGLMTRDTAPALAAGLAIRPFARSAADTLAWLRDGGSVGSAAGLTAEEEAALLRAWDARSAGR